MFRQVNVYYLEGANIKCKNINNKTIDYSYMSFDNKSTVNFMLRTNEVPDYNFSLDHFKANP